MGARRLAALWLVAAALHLAGCAPDAPDGGTARGRAGRPAPSLSATSSTAISATAPDTAAVDTTTPDPAAPETAPAAATTPEGSPSAPGAEFVGSVVARARGDVVVARSGPTDDAPVVAELANPVASGGALVFLVLTPSDQVDTEWLEVMLPVRPNGTVGWIRSGEVDLSLDPFRIEIDTAEHRLDLYEGEVLRLTTEIAVGVGATPTPHGEFYLAELLQPPDPGGLYGPYAFGLSGYSETLQSFAGGEGVVGIHGTNDPSSLGTDVSHGCVRVRNDVIVELAATVPLGTPVSITASTTTPSGRARRPTDR